MISNPNNSSSLAATSFYCEAQIREVTASTNADFIIQRLTDRKVYNFLSENYDETAISTSLVTQTVVETELFGL